MLMSECSFVDRDMFMRYLGGGIGHMAIAMQPEEDNAMNTDEDSNIMTNNHEAAAGAQVSELDESRLLLEELWRVASVMAEGGMADDREEVEQAPDSDSDDQDTDSEDEGTDDGMSVDSNNEEGEEDLGPEDGEDEGYLDSGYGAL
jgi:hypothetical protein